MSIVISVENLSKSYRLGQINTGTFTYDLQLWWAKMRGKPSPFLHIGDVDETHRDGELLWALKNVSFEVQQGEVLGIIGRNGAGKSTLLKILSRVTAPTSGKVKVKGRIASLLEVGTGFHPDLTGRENAYLNGAILGMSQQEVSRKFDEIVDFAGVEKFIDTPVKRYSSGMYVRLAFAVAAHLEPEILVVDEVLAVGDAEFQKKCLGKMGEVAHGGRTVLFVSHNMVAIQTLCHNAVWIDRGEIHLSGKSEKVVRDYLASSSQNSMKHEWDGEGDSPGNNEFRLRKAEILSMDGSSGPFSMRQALKVEFDYWNLCEDAILNLSVIVRDMQETVIFNTASNLEPKWHGKPFLKGLYRSNFIIPGDLLNEGTFRIELLAVHREQYVVHREPDILTFEVIDNGELRGTWQGKWPGFIHPQLAWKTEFVDVLTAIGTKEK
jgi:lipopolysaccharide transport system ATP-binding protein